jgi:7-cyano-7-deazaguanine synthase
MKGIISVSGGLDSTALLGFLFEQTNVTELIGVSFSYGSKHNKYENKACLRVMRYYDMPLIQMDLETAFSAFKSDLLLSGGCIPEGHYQSNNMKSTVVPARNMIFISILTGLAISKEFDFVAIGVHSGDHYIYPDGRPKFLSKIQDTVKWCSEGNIFLTAPFQFLTKGEIIKKVVNNKKRVPFELTRTCYKDQEIACGKCGSCIERKEAFEQNNLTDPIKYEE